MEAKLQKLKVSELKDLLSKNHLVQTGKKEDLIKRLIENNIGVDEPSEAPAEEDEELVDPEVAAPETSNADADAPTAETPAPIPTLTEEQKQLKLRAERFGIPFNPNPTPKSKPAPPPKATTTTKSDTPKSDAKPAAAPEKKGIDSNPLGLSEEVLAKRAAKFGIEKKEKTDVKEVKEVAAVEKKTEEISPEMAEKIAIEEEKKRKRLEKFGPVKTSTESTEPDAKKVKV